MQDNRCSLDLYQVEKQRDKNKKPKRCYLFNGDLSSCKGKTITKVEIITIESFVIKFNNESELLIELDQEYENINRPPRYSLFYGNLGKLQGKVVKKTELLAKDSFKFIFDDECELTVMTKFIDKNSKENIRTLVAILKTAKNELVILF